MVTKRIKNQTDADADLYKLVSSVHYSMGNILTAREDIAIDWYSNPANIAVKKAMLSMGNNKDLMRLIIYNKPRVVRNLDVLAKYLDDVIEKKLMIEAQKPGLSEEEGKALVELYNLCVDTRVRAAPLPTEGKLKEMDRKSLLAGLGRISDQYNDVKLKKGPSVAHQISRYIIQVC